MNALRRIRQLPLGARACVVGAVLGVPAVAGLVATLVWPAQRPLVGLLLLAYAAGWVAVTSVATQVGRRHDLLRLPQRLRAR